MPTLSKNIQIVLFMTVAQAVCLALGLWLQDQFIFASANWNFEQGVKAGTIALAESETGMPSSVLAESMLPGRMLGFVWIFGLQSIVAYLVLTRTFTRHDKDEMQSHEETLMKTKELVRTRDAVIFGLAKLAESRDPDTGQHLERIALYSTRLASALRRDERYRDAITPMFVRTIGISSALHDIGKVGVEDRVLLKPGKLEQDERFHMQTHTTLGGECIHQIEQRLGNSNFLEMAREIAFCHHERWDGEGYPVGLKGKEIPLAARIVSIADVYDALASRRVYKEPYSHDKCMEIIRQESGKQFDPTLIEVFVSIENQFREISQRFAEPQADFISASETDADRASHKASRDTSAQHPTEQRTSPSVSQPMSAEQEELLQKTIESDTQFEAPVGAS